MRILLVEDDEMLGDSLCAGLTHDGHTVDWLKTGVNLEQSLRHENFDLIVLDIGLPKMSGLTVLQNLRSNSCKIPVLILTANDSITAKVQGLDSGADDYVTKPFDLYELLARIRALQRRVSSRAEPMIYYQDIILDPASHTVSKAEQPVNIPRREFALLQKLLENPGRVMSREYLTQTLYGWGEDVDSNALEVHVHNLRKKLGGDFIRTIRGVGYMIVKEK